MIDLKFVKNIKGKRMTFLKIILCIFLMFAVTGCEPKKNEFTIRIFDSGINEEKISHERYYYDYTGSPVSFVIKVYCNGEEIYKTTLEDAINNEGPGSLITVRGDYCKFYSAGSSKTGNIHPVEKGLYFYEIEFNRMYRWNGEIIQKHILKDFFLVFYIDYDYFMSN